ncbi:aromatic ring-hydroxylating dioxygenase subunit alpha [soil metagenome]
MFPLNRWYVAAWGSELTTEPLARTLLNEPVVLFRGENGRAIALEDRCCHRNLPLSHGKVQGDCIACGYHGMVYDGRGQCVVAPGQDTILPAARVRSFPLVEQDEAVWIWMGDPALADSSDVPRYPFHSDPRWAHKSSYYLIKGNHELLNDNLIDLSHVGYVHGKTIGGTPEAHSVAEMRVDPKADGVTVKRFMRNTAPPPTYVRAVGFTGPIDRWMEIDFKPGLIQIYIGANDAGRGVDEVGRMDSLGIRIFNGITPETEVSTHYFWSASHNFKVDQPAVTDAFFGEIAATFEEDRTVIEAQQERFSRFPERTIVSLKSDGAGLRARRVVAEAVAQSRTATVGA